MVHSLCTIIFFCCFSCGINSGNDIYKKFPVGSLLSDTILKGADQIIPNNSDLILLYDISTEWDDFSPHLLFYDSTLRLYAASFFPSAKIDSIKNNVINAVVFDNRIKNKRSFRNDLPKKYQLNLYSSERVTTSFNRANKLVEKIELGTGGESLIFYILKSNDMFVAAGNERSPTTDPAFLKNFTIRDTIKYPITDIIFDFDKSVVKRKFMESNTFIHEQMMLVNKCVLLNIYQEIIKLH